MKRSRSGGSGCSSGMVFDIVSSAAGPILATSNGISKPWRHRSPGLTKKISGSIIEHFLSKETTFALLQHATARQVTASENLHFSSKSLTHISLRLPQDSGTGRFP